MHFSDKNANGVMDRSVWHSDPDASLDERHASIHPQNDPRLPPCRPRLMKWWQRALLVPVLWIVFTVGGGFFLTQVVLHGKVTAEQGRAIGETLGQACGVGVAFIWVACAVFRKKPPGAGGPA
jgi:hypothetical protein